jgi:hypothetical protein
VVVIIHDDVHRVPGVYLGQAIFVTAECCASSAIDETEKTTRPGLPLQDVLVQAEPPDLVLELIHDELRHGRQTQDVRARRVRHKAYSLQSIEDH